MTGALTAMAWTVAATTTKKSSGISPIIIIYAVIAAGFYFLYYRPRKRKAQAAREQTAAWEVGDEVLTAGGIVGYIIDVDGDRVTLETSVGASFVVLKQYVIRKLEEPAGADDEDASYDDAEYDDAEHDDDEHGGDEHGDHEDHDGGSDEDESPGREGDASDGDPSDAEWSSNNGKGGASGTSRSAEGDDSGSQDAPPIV